MRKPIIIGVAGGSCSGKTTFISETQKLLGDARCGILYQDHYYIDQSAHFDGDGKSVNFDHPDAIEFSLLALHLDTLKSRQDIEVPIYDFNTHKRQKETTPFAAKDIILVDGILILSQMQIIDRLDYSIFIECDEQTRLERRINRDTKERGRSQEGIIEQFTKHVAPMHKKFVEPSKNRADKILTQIDIYELLDQRINMIEQLIAPNK